MKAYWEMKGWNITKTVISSKMARLSDGNPIGVDRENWEQTASGGGTRELADEAVGFFKEVEISEVKNNGKQLK